MTTVTQERVCWPSHAPTERPLRDNLRRVTQEAIEFLLPLSEEQVLELARTTVEQDAYWMHELVLWACHLRTGDKDAMARALLNNPIITPSQSALLVSSIRSAATTQAFIATDNFHVVENWHAHLPHTLWQATLEGFHARNRTESMWRDAMGQIFNTKSLRVKDAYAARTSLRESIVRVFSRGAHRERISLGANNRYLSGEEAMWFIDPPGHVWFRVGQSEVDLRIAIARNPDVGHWFVGDGQSYTDIERMLAEDNDMLVRRSMWRNPHIRSEAREQLDMEFGPRPPEPEPVAST